MIRIENFSVLALDLSLLDTERTFGSSRDLTQWYLHNILWPKNDFPNKAFSSDMDIA
jgi:hypothetical protein